MHTILKTIWVVVFFLVLSMSTNSLAAEKDAKAEFQALEDQYAAAGNAGDAAKLAAMYAEDAMVLPPELKAIEGRPAIERFWKKALEPGIKQTAKTLEAVVLGNVANETGTYLLKNPNGEIVEEGNYITIWKRVGNSWKIHREIWNITTKAGAK
jgi:uncharacterized protein (TIGR02246 family)